MLSLPAETFRRFLNHFDPQIGVYWNRGHPATIISPLPVAGAKSCRDLRGLHPPNIWEPERGAYRQGPPLAEIKCWAGYL